LLHYPSLICYSISGELRTRLFPGTEMKQASDFRYDIDEAELIIAATIDSLLTSVTQEEIKNTVMKNWSNPK